MRNSVDTGGGGESLGCAHVKIRVNDSHVRKKLIVGQRIFYAACFVGDNSERSDLRAGACRGGNGNEVCLFAHLREGVNTLSDVDEAHCHIHEVRFGVFIKHPHDFCRVHCGAAAEGDDAVGPESVHLRRALLCRSKGRVGLNVKECCVSNAHFVKNVGDKL